MIITKLELDDFAGLSDFHLDLTNGINVFYGENGTGKTTLGLFIKTMLYGVGNDRKRDDVTTRMRIIPIGASKASGRMTIEVGGRRLEIARTFGRTKKFDRTMMIWLDDAARLDTAKEPGEYFLGLHEEIFNRTFFVGEMNQAVLPDGQGELNTRLMNLQVTGHENMDYQRAVKKLKDEVRRITNQRGSGRLDELLRQEVILSERQENLKNLTTDIEALKEQLAADQAKKAELISELEVLKQRSDSLEQLKELEDYERAMLLLAKKADLEERIRKIKSPLDPMETARLKDRLEVFLQADEKLVQKAESHNLEAEELAHWESSFNEGLDRLFHPANERIIREHLAEKELLEANIGLLEGLTPQKKAALQAGLDELKKNRKKADVLASRRIWLIPAAGLIFTGSFALLGANSGVILAGAVASLILAYLLLKYQNAWRDGCARKTQVLQENLATLWADKTGERLLALIEGDPDFSPQEALPQWETKYQLLTDKVTGLGLAMADLGDYLKEQIQYTSRKSQWQERLAELEINHGILQSAAERSARERAHLAEALSPLELSPDRSALASLERQLGQLEIQQAEKAELEVTMAELTRLSQERNLNPILLEPQKHREEGVRRELDLQRQLLQETDRVKAEMSELDILMAKAKTQIQNLAGLLSDHAKATGSLEKTTQEIEALRKRQRILELALENLEASYQEIQRDYLPRVSQLVSETFNDLTGGQFQRVLLSADFRMKVPLAGELSSMEFLSRGNLDLLWLGLRLSLCAIIIRGEKAPLIFDDSFLHLDEKRLKNVLRYLSERIDGQIIILTCHHRETRLLNEMDLL